MQPVKKICSVPGCGRDHKGLGFCRMHYNRFTRHGNPLVTKHVFKTNPVKKCTVPGCDNEHSIHGFCQLHGTRFTREGSPGELEARKALPGSGSIDNGYKKTMIDGVRKRDHRRIIEDLLSFNLPEKAIVHHIDGNGLNNSPDNLVICQDNTYHQLIHQRQRAYDTCGHADWLKCHICKQYDKPENLAIYKSNPGKTIRHKDCFAFSCKLRRSKLKTERIRENI